MHLSRRLFMVLAGAGAGTTAAAAAGRDRPAAAAPATTAELCDLPAGSRVHGAVRAVPGRSAPGDGGGGQFWWDADAADPPDGGTVFAPADGGAGRWRRLIDGDWQAAWFGVRGDGAGDDGPALSRAIDAAAGRRLMLPRGVLRIATPLDPAASAWHIRGQMPERGQYRTDNATILDASAIGPGRWLVNRYDRTPPFDRTIGPFVQADIDVRLGETNGFAFGSAAPDGSADPDRYETVRDREGQTYVHGVRFEGCRIRGGIADHASDARGRLARTGQRLILLTKCFESTIEDCALVGGDVQIETWGCDAPVMRNLRCNNGHLPFLLRRSGWFGVQHRLADIQIESFTFGAVVSDGVQLAASRIRTEPNLRAGPRGMGRFDLTAATGLTAAVTRGSDRLRLSGEADGILFPGLSLLEIGGPGAEADTCLVTDVRGREVTVWSRGFGFARSAEAARLVRIHGYAMMHGGAHDALIGDSHPDAVRDCPTFVYRPDNGGMFLTNIGKVPGSNGDVRSLVLGNVERDAAAPRRRMGFANCAEAVVAEGWHPSVTVDAPFPPVADPDDPAPARLVYTPRSWRAAGTPFRRVEDPAGARAAWLVEEHPIELPGPPGSYGADLFVRAADRPATLRWAAGDAEGSHAVDGGSGWQRVRLDGLAAGTALQLSAEGGVMVAAVRLTRTD